MRRWICVVAMLASAFGVDHTGGQYKISAAHDSGAFNGTISLTAEGPSRKAKLSWLAVIQNSSPAFLHHVDLCVMVSDKAGKPIKPGGDECVLKLYASNWQSVGSLTFKGSQKVVLSDSNDPPSFGAVSLKVIGTRKQPKSMQSFPPKCNLLWPSAIKAMADRKFRPLILDKDSFTATFAYEGGQINGLDAAEKVIRTNTTAKTTGLSPDWLGFRVDSSSLYLRDSPNGGCTAEIKFAYAGFTRRQGWLVLETNHNLEGSILAELEKAAGEAITDDRAKGIAEISNQPRQADQPNRDLAAQIESLGKMFSSGLLTAEEFQQAKKKLLEPPKTSPPTQ